MTISIPETANLQIRMTNKGRLEAYWKGEKLPCVRISVDAERGERADVTLSFVGPCVNLHTQSDET